jgi:hypothetical protein
LAAGQKTLSRQKNIKKYNILQDKPPPFSPPPPPSNPTPYFINDHSAV